MECAKTVRWEKTRVLTVEMERIRREAFRKTPDAKALMSNRTDLRLNKWKSCLIWLSESQIHTDRPGIDTLLLFRPDGVFMKEMNTHTRGQRCFLHACAHTVISHPLRTTWGLKRKELSMIWLLMAFRLRGKNLALCAHTHAHTHNPEKTHTYCKWEIKQVMNRHSGWPAPCLLGLERGMKNKTRGTQPRNWRKSSVHQRFF